MTTTSNHLLIVGASVRAAAQSALRAELSVWGADLFADEDFKAIAIAQQIDRYPTGFLTALAKSPETPWIYTGALENYPRLVRRLETLRPLRGNGSETIKQVRDPILLSRELSDAGIAYPKTYRIPPNSEADDFPFEADPESWLIKPARSAAGNSIRLLSQSHTFLRRHNFRKQPLICQQLISGNSVSAVFLGARGKAVLLGLTRQLNGCLELGAEGFTYCGSLGPVPLSDVERSELQYIGNTLADRFALTGLFGVDLIQKADPGDRTSPNFVVIEVNPRYTASIEVLEKALGFSTIQWHLQACMEGTLPDQTQIDSLKPVSWQAKGILFARKNAHFHPTLADYVSQQNRDAKQPRIADIPKLGTTLMTGRPVVTLFAEADTETRAQIALLDAVNDFESVLYQKYG